MASVRERRSKSGETTWAVLYRQGEKQCSKTFDNPTAADRVAQLINTLGPERGLKTWAEEQPGRARGLTLDELVQPWFASKTRNMSARGLADYRRDYTNWIKPTFGHREAALIDELDVQNWVDVVLAPLSAKTVADRHALLHQIFKWGSARKRALVPHNPCLETDLPKRRRKPPKGLTWPEWMALRDAAYRVNEESADLILFIASTGWRIGEATALRVTAVDDSDAYMYVSMTHVNRKGEGVVEGSKSEAGLRRIRMLPEAAAMLRRRMVGKGPNDLVFTNSHSPLGLWEPSTFRNRWWRKSVVEAGLVERKPTPHWLRHTHVLLCHKAGMGLAEIQRRIGHEDIKTTINVYGRLIDDMDDSVTTALDALVSGAAPQVVVGQVIQPAALGS